MVLTGPVRQNSPLAVASVSSTTRTISDVWIISPRPSPSPSRTAGRGPGRPGGRGRGPPLPLRASLGRGGLGLDGRPQGTTDPCGRQGRGRRHVPVHPKGRQSGRRPAHARGRRTTSSTRSASTLDIATYRTLVFVATLVVVRFVASVVCVRPRRRTCSEEGRREPVMTMVPCYDEGRRRALRKPTKSVLDAACPRRERDPRRGRRRPRRGNGDNGSAPRAPGRHPRLRTSTRFEDDALRARPRRLRPRREPARGVRRGMPRKGRESLECVAVAEAGSAPRGPRPPPSRGERGAERDPRPGRRGAPRSHPTTGGSFAGPDPANERPRGGPEPAGGRGPGSRRPSAPTPGGGTPRASRARRTARTRRRRSRRSEARPRRTTRPAPGDRDPGVFERCDSPPPRESVRVVVRVRVACLPGRWTAYHIVARRPAPRSLPSRRGTRARRTRTALASALVRADGARRLGREGRAPIPSGFERRISSGGFRPACISPGGARRAAPSVDPSSSSLREPPNPNRPPLAEPDLAVLRDVERRSRTPAPTRSCRDTSRSSEAHRWRCEGRVRG